MKKRIFCMFFCGALLFTACGKDENIISPKSYGQILSEMQENKDNDIHSQLLIFPNAEMATEYIKECNHEESPSVMVQAPMNTPCWMKKISLLFMCFHN